MRNETHQNAQKHHLFVKYSSTVSVLLGFTQCRSPDSWTEWKGDRTQITQRGLAFAPSFQKHARTAQNISVCKGPANKHAAIRHPTRLRWRGGPAPEPAPSVA